jgi:ADP-heptose:LPS heptosyltransferase
MYLIYRLIDFIFTMYARCESKNKSIAIIRVDAIGDFVIWLDSAKEYRRLYPGKKIVLIANSAWANWASNFPFWDEVLHLNLNEFRRNLKYRIKMLRLIRNAGFEIVIQPTYSRTFHGDSLVRASAAIHRIGSNGDISNIDVGVKAVCDRWYSSLITASNYQLMELDRNAEFIRNLSGQNFNAAVSQLPKSAVNTNLSFSSKNYIVLFPGASWSGKRWPLEKFRELANMLYDEHRMSFILCGGPDDINLCKKLGAELDVPFMNLAGKTSLDQLSGVISQSRLLISNDTSAVHIAAAVGRPSICILGGGHHGRFLPYSVDLQGVKPVVIDYKMSCFNCNWNCSQPHDILGPMPCIQNISVEKVAALANKILFLNES